MDYEDIKRRFGGPKIQSRLEQLLAAKDEVAKPAGEAIGQFYQALLSLPELKLSGGVTAKVEPFFPPQEDAEGRLHCGIDLQLSNGNLLEFTFKNTGWGKSFVASLAPRTDQ